MKLSLTDKTKPLSTPSHLLLYGPPKTGKNTAVALLPDHLILNLDDGCKYLETCATPYINTLDGLEEALDAIHEMDPKPRFLVVDTVDKLQDLAILRAVEAYNAKFGKGKLSNRDDLFALEYGAGYGWLRGSFDYYLNEFFELQIPTIWLAHVRYRHLNDATEEKADKKRMMGNKPRELSLIGLICDKICADMCLIGYLYRDGDKLMMDTTPGESNGIGTRLRHLDSRQFLLSERVKGGEVVAGPGWEEIFGPLMGDKLSGKKKPRK